MLLRRSQSGRLVPIVRAATGRFFVFLILNVIPSAAPTTMAYLLRRRAPNHLRTTQAQCQCAIGGRRTTRRACGITGTDMCAHRQHAKDVANLCRRQTRELRESMSMSNAQCIANRVWNSSRVTRRSARRVVRGSDCILPAKHADGDSGTDSAAHCASREEVALPILDLLPQ